LIHLLFATCIGCGCTDDERCERGCTWLRIDYLNGHGVCSNCDAHEARFDAGDRSEWFGPLLPDGEPWPMRLAG